VTLLHGEGGEVDKNDPVLLQKIKELKNIIAGYDLKNVYNMDETGLFFRVIELVVSDAEEEFDNGLYQGEMQSIAFSDVLDSVMALSDDFERLKCNEDASKEAIRNCLDSFASLKHHLKRGHSDMVHAKSQKKKQMTILDFFSSS